MHTGLRFDRALFVTTIVIRWLASAVLARRDNRSDPPS
jgi:hypothetical protein